MRQTAPITAATPSNYHYLCPPGPAQKGMTGLFTVGSTVHRPGRYLIQLCSHANDMGQHRRHRRRAHPSDNTSERPQIQHAEWSDTFGILRSARKIT